MNKLKHHRRKEIPPKTEIENRNWGRNDWLLALALFAAVLLAYQPAWNGKPVWDDNAHLTGPELRSVHGLEQIWIRPGVTQQYYPLVYSVFWLEQKSWGDAPLGYHLVNILLHFASALLLVKILRRLAVPGAWLAAAFWALHPVQVESVAWMSELKNTLSGFFYLGAALIYLNFDRTRRRNIYFLALALFVAGLLAKTVIATLPAALLLVFWWQRKKLQWKHDVLPLAPFLVAGISLGLFTAWVERTFVIVSAEAASHPSLVERSLIAGRAIWFYLGKLVWPQPLIFLYPRWDVNSAVWWQYLFPVALLLLVAGLWQLRRRLVAAPLVALLFFCGTLFPALGFFDVYPFRFSYVADHFQYLACIGPLVLLAAGMALGFGRLSKPKTFLYPIFCATMLTGFAWLTWRQCGMFADVETLWRTTIARNPGCWLAYDNLGDALSRQGRDAEAITCFKKELDLKPDYEVAHDNLGVVYAQVGRIEEAIGQYHRALEIWPDYVEAHNNLGNAYLQAGRMNEAVVEFRQALKLQPRSAAAHNGLGIAAFQAGRVDEAIDEYGQAVEMQPGYAEAHSNLGAAYLQAGRVEEAAGEYRRALKIQPAFAPAHYNLGNIWLQQQRIPEAMNEYRIALGISPDYVVAHISLGLACLQLGQVEEAISEYRRALALQPDNVDALNNLAWVLATCPPASPSRTAEALELAGRASQLSGGNNPQILRTLAAAYAAVARYDEAAVTARRALDLAGIQKNGPMADALRQELKLYTAGMPLRQTK